MSTKVERQKTDGGDPAKPRARRINDAVKALGICRATIYVMAKRGELRLVRVGGRTLVPESEIDRLLGEGQ